MTPPPPGQQATADAHPHPAHQGAGGVTTTDTTIDDPFLARLAALDDALAYQAQLNMDERDPAKAAACDNARLGLGMARDAYLLLHPEEVA